MNKKQKKVFYRILITIALLIIIRILPSPQSRLIEALLYGIPYLIMGQETLKKALKGIKKHQVFDENFLMAVATVGAYALGEYDEAVFVMLFYQIGELFESYAVGKSRQNISDLMDIRPDYANVEIDGKLSSVDPQEVKVGTIITVLPGERVPLDGVVVEGQSSLNTAALTGESAPRNVEVDDDVISGCINNEGILKIRTTKEFEESTVSKILDLVENASNLKAQPEEFISKFAHYYTPIVCYSALALAIIPPVVLMMAGKDSNWASWLYRALSFLVISCPCALVISIPLSFFAGLGGSSKEGILIKGSSYLETLSKIKYIIFDKTGTITKGVFEVVGIHHNVIEEEKLLEYAAYCEAFSSHPIARSIKKAYGKTIDETRIKDVKEYGGHGIEAIVDEHNVAVGNDRLMNKLGIEFKPCSSIGTIIHVAIDGQYMGHLVICDVIKENAKESIKELKKAGIVKTVMLTGDSNKVGQQVAKELGISEVYCELLPQDKVSEVEKILKQANGKVAFVGDGINDAPVLRRVDIGIAMGALGSDAAIEAADVVLMDDDLLKIAKSIKISKKCIRIVYENIYFAISVKVICLILGALGITGMWMAIFADVGVMVIAVINAIRALFVKGL